MKGKPLYEVEILKVAISSELDEELQQMVFRVDDAQYLVYWAKRKRYSNNRPTRNDYLNNTGNNAGSDTAIHAGHYFLFYFKKNGKIFDFIERVRLNFDIKKGARCNENHVN